MANTQKKIDKLNAYIIGLEKERRDHLTKKTSGSGEINLASFQKKIDDTRAKIKDLQKTK